MKPRYEFVIIFTWKEPTPSDKLRPIKKFEAPVTAGPMAPGGLPGPAPSSPPPPPSGDGGGLSAGAGRKGGDD